MRTRQPLLNSGAEEMGPVETFLTGVWTMALLTGSYLIMLAISVAVIVLLAKLIMVPFGG